MRKKKLDSTKFEDWQERHKSSGKCDQNHFGTSLSMESTIAEVLWLRSGKLRYTNLVSDGDAKTYSHLLKLKPYGEVPITKQECVNHVQKRVTNGLEKLRKQMKLPRNYEGGLTRAKVLRLSKYFGNAIRNNIGSLEKMKTAIYATLYHCKSTEKEKNCLES